ncbi:MAG TPA: hypothetical protein VFO59_01945, partial [Dehalococcoidia bacterium]|nr:hypothetical protein [Dehalococcoidia bacterium]
VLARWVLILAVAVSGLVIFLGFSMFSIGSAEVTDEVMDEEEVLLEEYLGLSDEEARQEAEEAGTVVEEEDTEEGHA